MVLDRGKEAKGRAEMVEAGAKKGVRKGCYSSYSFIFRTGKFYIFSPMPFSL